MTMVQWKDGCDYYLLSYQQFPPNFAVQKKFEKLLFTATIGMPLQANGDCDVTESYLE